MKYYIFIRRIFETFKTSRASLYTLTLTLYVQFSSVTQSYPTLCDPMNHSTPGLPTHHKHPEPPQTHVHWVDDPSNHLILRHQVFSNESALHIRWPKYWSFSTSILPMNTQDWSPLGWTGWISLQSNRLSRLPQHHSSKASILRYSAFFIVHSHIHT